MVIVRIVRRTEPTVIVRLADGTHVAIPEWMLDAAYCAALPEESRPRLSLEALVELRDLADRHPWSKARTASR